MKKNFITFIMLIAFVAVSSTAGAQVKFGVRGEVGLNKPTFTGSGILENFRVENMNTFKIGPTVEYNMPFIGLGVDASLLYSNEKMNVQNEINGNVLNEIASVQSHNLELPVNLKYKVGIISILKGYVAAGPFIGVNLSNDDFKDLEKVTTNIEQKKFQAGLNFGFGAEVINRVQLGFNYHLKLTDDYSVDKAEYNDLFNENNKGFWSFTANVYF